MEKENKKVPLILVIALPILLILSTELVNVSFSLFGQQFYLITFIFPLTFLVSLLISKKAESKNAIWLMILALIMQCFAFVIGWSLLGRVNYVLMEASFLAFLFSQMIALLGYEVLKESKRMNKYGYLLILLIIATLIDSMFFIIVYPEMTCATFIANFIVKVIYDLIIAKIIEK